MRKKHDMLSCHSPFAQLSNLRMQRDKCDCLSVIFAIFQIVDVQTNMKKYLDLKLSWSEDENACG